MNWVLVLTATLAGVVSAVITDFQSFAKARSADPKATYDWALAGTRWAIGGLTAMLPAIPVGAVVH